MAAQHSEFVSNADVMTQPDTPLLAREGGGSATLQTAEGMGRDAAIYAVGGILGRGLPVLLMPLYTRAFTTDEYGVIELLLMLAAFVAPLLLMGMDSAQSYYFFADAIGGRPSQTRVVTAVLQWQFVWGATMTGVAVAISPLLSRWFFADAVPVSFFSLAFASMWLSQMTTTAVDVFRLQRKPLRYVSFMIAQGVLTAVVTLWLVQREHAGVIGYLFGALIGAVVAMAVAWWMLGGILDLRRLHSDLWFRLLQFGAPLMPAALAVYVTATADRWLVSHYWGAAELGIYSAGAKVALIVTLGVETFRKAWWPIVMEAVHHGHGRELTRVAARYYFGAGAILVTLLAAAAPMVARFAMAPEYRGAYSVVAPLGAASVLYGSLMVAGIGLWQAKQTKAFAGALLSAAALNVVLGVVLVPRYGGLGAAIATAGSYLFATVGVGWLAERIWPVEYPVRALSAMLIVAAGAVILIEEAQSHGRSAWTVLAYTISAVTIIAVLTRGRSPLRRESLGLSQPANDPGAT